MNVTIRSETREYHVSFEQDNSKVFIKGPHTGGLKTVTECKIFLLTGANSLGLTRTLISTGVTTLGSRDKPDSYIGCKEAFTRALSTTYFSKAETTVFWKEFHIRHKRIDAVKPVSNFTHEYGGPVHGYGGLHSHQQRAAKKLPALGQPRYGLDAFYGHRRHEYGGIIQSYMNQPAQIYSVGSGKTVNVRKLHGLGWKRIIDDHTGETIWPRSQATKLQQLRDMYGYSLRDNINRIEQFCRQAESRCHGVGPAKMGGAGAKRVRDIISEADDRLTARMQAMPAGLAAKVDERLVKRPGISKFLGEYIIDADKFVPAFKEGETVTYMGDKAKVFNIHGPMVTIHCGGRSYEKFDHEIEKRPGLLRRTVAWLRTMAKIHRDGGLTEAETDGTAKIPGRGLWNMIENNYCDSCQQHLPGDTENMFLEGPSGGSCKNIKCSFCGQRYWLDPASMTAEKLDD